MGTPDFAVASLDAIVKNKLNVVAVVTAPDRPAGRGLKLQESAIKKYATRHNIPVLQPQKLKDPHFLSELGSFRADLQVVVAFRMLPEVVWNMPELGTINLHASLLPQYRGAAPINWAIINGEKITGVTTFKLKHEIDTGNILLQQAMEIGEAETAGELHDRLKTAGAGLLVSTIQALTRGNLEEKPQSNAETIEWIIGDPENPDEQRKYVIENKEIKHAPKIFTGNAQINWNMKIDEIYNLIRGLSPYPGAFTELKDKTLKIFSAEKEYAIPTSKHGKWESDGKNWLKFAASDGYIHVKDVQLEGKKRMPVDEFLKGYRF